MSHLVHMLQRRYPRGTHLFIAGVLASGAALLVGIGLVLAR